MIDTVRFKNFKALRDVTVPLSPFTLIIGPNSSGKTSILEGLHHITQFGAKPPSLVLSGPHDPAVVRTSKADGPIEFEVEGQFGSPPQAGRLSAILAPERVGAIVRWTQQVTRAWGGTPTRVGIQGGWTDAFYQDADADPLMRAIRSAVRLQFEPSRLAARSTLSGSEAKVEHDGYGLASVVAEISSQSESGLADLRKSVKKIVPGLIGVRAKSVQVSRTVQERVSIGGNESWVSMERKVPGHELRFSFPMGDDIPATAVSEGTLLVLGLMAAAANSNGPLLILLDELERGLHPAALGRLVEALREYLISRPGSQIVATTHSPYLVDHFKAEEVVLTDLDPEKGVQVRRLSDHPDYPRWKPIAQPGEFWTAVGEGWVTAGASENGTGSH